MAKFWIAAVSLSFLMAGMAEAGYAAHPYSYDFALDSGQSSVSFTVWIRQNGVVKDSESGIMTGSGTISADLTQTGAWFQDFSQIDLTKLDLQVDGNPSLNLSWVDNTFFIPVQCTVDVTVNNLAVHDAGETGTSPVDSWGKFIVPQYKYLGEGTVDYSYNIAGGLYRGSGTEDLADYNDGVNNVAGISGRIEQTGSAVRLLMDQAIVGSQDLSGYAPGYSMTYEIHATLVSSAEEIRSPLLGDANFDGKVDVGDLGILAGSYGGPGNWSTGDFNFDGKVDVGDLGILAGSYGRTESTGGLVPEPMTLGLMGLFAIAGLIRRKR